MDHLSKKNRSINMSKIRSKNTRPELIVRKYLFSKGFRYRLHAKDVTGKPDLSNKTSKIAVFVNGCFWHQHKGCKKATIPKTNKAYWLPKLNKNVVRFKKSKNELKKMNLKIVVIWECEINDTRKILKRFEPKNKKKQ